MFLNCKKSLGRASSFTLIYGISNEFPYFNLHFVKYFPAIHVSDTTYKQRTFNKYRKLGF